ncbi:MAG: hypothetical protein LN567_03195 [Rickettsia endosymbiont of Graphium doson]|nr:hypothetical protein [Rickettsia endosymbiont of Graphium doson]
MNKLIKKLTWSVKEIVYDKPLLNHPKLLELALSKFSLQEIAELSNKLNSDLIEAITNYDYELVLAALMSVENAEV